MVQDGTAHEANITQNIPSTVKAAAVVYLEPLPVQTNPSYVSVWTGQD